MTDVSNVTIDFTAKTARITMNPGKVVDRQTVEDTLRAKGYGVFTFEEIAPAAKED